MPRLIEAAESEIGGDIFVLSGALEMVLDEFSLVPLEATMAVLASKLRAQHTKSLVVFVSGEFACSPVGPLLECC